MDQSYHPYWEDSYQMGSYCAFCHQRTDETIEYNYCGVELDEKKFPIRAHRRCYLKEKIKIFVYFLAPFIIIFSAMVCLERFFLNASISFWQWALNFAIGTLFSLIIGIRLFFKWEKKIVYYKRSHTNYENYYKSDELKWRR